MTSRLAQGDSKEEAATFAYETLAFPMLTGSFVTAAGFVPIGFARSAAGEYTFSIFAVVTHRADRFLVRRCSVCAFARRRASQEAGGRRLPRQQADGHADIPRHPCWRDEDALAHDRCDAGLFRASASGDALCAAAVFPGVRPS